MTANARQRWMFRLSILVGLLAAVPAVAYWTGRPVPAIVLLGVVFALLCAGIAAMVLGLQHMRELARHRSHRR